ncbi:MAG: pilus assembly protein PilM [Bacteroidales bacterium]|nr:pilus assembly protein PilM [Bacteroidales bacterium]
MMTQENNYALVFDIGSSCIKLCLGEKMDDALRILSVIKRPIGSEIRRGMVQKSQEVSLLLEDMLNELKASVDFDFEIDNIYVGINAYGMRSLPLQASFELNYERVVDDAVLDELFDEAMSNFNDQDDFDSRHTFVQEYVVDGFRTMNPAGEKPRKIDAYYKVVMGKNQIFRNLEAALDETSLQGKYHLELGVIASAVAVLSKEDKEKGVVVVDFGAETTGICVIKDDVVRHVAILPFGGQNITRDLTQIAGLSLQEAEALKIEKGNALHYTELMMRAKKENGRQLEFNGPDKEVNEIVVARIEEIVDNIWAQIRYAWSTPSTLANGIVITGGASRLKNLVNLLHQKTNLQVRQSSIEPEMAQVYGLMELAKENCISLLERQAEEETFVDEDLFAATEVETQQEETQASVETIIETPAAAKQNEKREKSRTKNPVGGIKNGGKFFKDLFTSLTDDN